MLIDQSHRSWAVASVVILVVSAVVYVPYAFGATRPSGGSVLGITYGVVGFAMMLYAGFLGARKKVPVWRLGRAQSWMRGHLWLGTLSFPIILFHSGLTFGGGLALVLMLLFTIVVASGIVGAYLQHTVPRRILRDVPMETIYEQIGHVREQLVDEADTLVAEACGKLEFVTVVPTAALASAGVERDNTPATDLASTDRIDAEETAPLREFYKREMRPFVAKPVAGHPLADPVTAGLKFAAVRTQVPASLHPALTDLENICEEERQLMRQYRMYRLLHSWLVVHLPLSVALLALAVIHIVVALRY